MLRECENGRPRGARPRIGKEARDLIRRVLRTRYAIRNVPTRAETPYQDIDCRMIAIAFLPEAMHSLSDEIGNLTREISRR